MKEPPHQVKHGVSCISRSHRRRLLSAGSDRQAFRGRLAGGVIALIQELGQANGRTSSIGTTASPTKTNLW